MRTAINPITGEVLSETFNKVLTYGLTEEEMQCLSKSVVEGTTILACEN